MDFVEYPIQSHAVSASGDVGILRCFRSPLLGNVVEAIWDCDVPDGDAAKTLTIKCAPGTPLLLMAQYRKPAEIRQGARLLPRKCATQILSNAVTLRPTGALGVVIVCLRPDAASRIVEAPVKDFANADIHLASLFGNGEVAMCDELLAGARTSQERISGIYSFLLRHLRPHVDSLASRAAALLMKNPTVRMHSLAAMLGFSDRHLLRDFNAAFGMSPKRFARLARFQKVLAERRNCGSWAQVAHACGLADQPHLVKEFREMVGESPTEFFAHEIVLETRGIDEANIIIQHAA
jgi:AraC-like DNA-binding protein